MSLLDIKGRSREHVPTFIYETPEEASKVVALEIAALIKQRRKKSKVAVLGLTTRITPKLIYKELVRMHKEEGLSFKNVVAFNLDEFYPIESDAPQSYHKYMHDHLFDHVDILPENINILDGTVQLDQIDAHCAAYEDKIKSYGGIDIQILGTGRSGHIGFNEPGSSMQSNTRLVKLDPLTIADNVEDFIKPEYVPLRALTMGVNTILRSKKIRLMAWGERKADIIKKVVQGSITDEVPASYLQEHENVEVLIDQWAASYLTRVQYPWLVSVCKWDEKLTKRAVIWLSQKLKKPILRLIDEDYTDNHLGELLMYYGSYYELNKWVFNSLRNTITGWPGGKPNADDTNRPTRALPAKKRVVLFSPHPDDDVISMGGTFLRLVEQGHEVHVAYQTSGNIAVTDDDARRFAEFSKDLCEKLKDSGCEMVKLYEDIEHFLKKKKLGEPDIPSVRLIKGLIRKGEAAAACRYFGLPDNQIHFLNLPFYETGTIDKAPVGEADFKIIMDLLKEVKPHQVYAAGDLRDPHGTHRVCLDAIFESLRRLKVTDDWIKDCWLWLYRGAWHEWDIEEIEMAVPISPLELMKKRKAIFKHQSQKDDVVFQGSDKREFWERAEDRNRLTASLYDQLGLIEYEAMEAFVRYHY